MSDSNIVVKRRDYPQSNKTLKILDLDFTVDAGFELLFAAS